MLLHALLSTRKNERLVCIETVFETKVTRASETKRDEPSRSVSCRVEGRTALNGSKFKLRRENWKLLYVRVRRALFLPLCCVLQLRRQNRRRSSALVGWWVGVVRSLFSRKSFFSTRVHAAIPIPVRIWLRCGEATVLRRVRVVRLSLVDDFFDLVFSWK